MRMSRQCDVGLEPERQHLFTGSFFFGRRRLNWMEGKRLQSAAVFMVHCLRLPVLLGGVEDVIYDRSAVSHLYNAWNMLVEGSSRYGRIFYCNV